MIIRKSFNLWLQNDESPIKVSHEIGTDPPDAIGVLVDRCEDIEQMLDICVLRYYPLRFSKVEYQ